MLSRLKKLFCWKAKKSANAQAPDEVKTMKSNQPPHSIARRRDDSPDREERKPRVVSLSTNHASLISRSKRAGVPSCHCRSSSVIVPTTLIQETGIQSAGNNKNDIEPIAVPFVPSISQIDLPNTLEQHKSDDHRLIDHVNQLSQTLDCMRTSLEIHAPLKQLEPFSKRTASIIIVPIAQSTTLEIFQNPWGSTSLLALPIIEIARPVADEVDTSALTATPTPVTIIRHPLALDPPSSCQTSVYDCADAQEDNPYEKTQVISPTGPNAQQQDDSFYYYSLKSRLQCAKDYCELMNHHKAADQDTSSPEFDEQYLRFLARRFIQVFATAEQVTETTISQVQQHDQHYIAATNLDSPILADTLLTTTEGSHDIKFQGSDLYQEQTYSNETLVRNDEGASEVMAWLESLDLVHDPYVHANTIFYDATTENLWEEQTEQDLKDQTPAEEHLLPEEHDSLEAYDEELSHDHDSLYDYLLHTIEIPTRTHVDILEHVAPGHGRLTTERLSPNLETRSEAVPMVMQAAENAQATLQYSWQSQYIDINHEDFTTADEYRMDVESSECNQYKYLPLKQKATDTAEPMVRTPCAVPASPYPVDEPPTWLTGYHTSNTASDEVDQTFYSIVPETPPYARETFTRTTPEDEEDRQTVECWSPGGGDNELSRAQLLEFLSTFRGALELMTSQRDAAVAKSTQIMKENMALRQIQSEQAARLEQLDRLFSQQREVTTKYTDIIERQIVEIYQLNAKLSAMDYREGIAQIQMKEMARLQLRMGSSRACSDVFQTDDVFVTIDEDSSDESMFF